MSSFRARKHAHTRSRHPIALIVLSIPILIWIGVAAAFFVITGDRDLQLDRPVGSVILGVGALLISGLIWVAFVLFMLLDSADGLDTAASTELGVGVEDPRILIPPAFLPVWEELDAKHDEEFATWIISQADASQTVEDIRRSAEEKSAAWNRAHSRYDTARHEAGHSVVGIALGRVPVWSTARQDLGVGDCVGETVFHDDFPRIDPVEASWDGLRIAAAGFASQIRGSDPYFGAEGDVNSMRDDALELVAFGRRPVGYTGEMTVEALIREAVVEAESILGTHASAVEEICQALMGKDALGGFELRAVFEQHSK